MKAKKFRHIDHALSYREAHYRNMKCRQSALCLGYMEQLRAYGFVLRDKVNENIRSAAEKCNDVRRISEFNLLSLVTYENRCDTLTLVEIKRLSLEDLYRLDQMAMFAYTYLENA